jgi:hypothetical protein
MPVILATQEAEIRRIVVQSQPQTNSETLSQKYPTQKIVETTQVEITQGKCIKLSKKIARTEIQVISILKGQEKVENQRTQ